jgi:hypothetical protein
VPRSSCTSQPRQGVRDSRHRRSATVRAQPIREPVQLELPLGRLSAEGAILERSSCSRNRADRLQGFDERTWLRRHGIHVVARVDALAR